jgi:hypothetical protein
MTFAQFKASVLTNLGPDAARSGTGTSGLDAFKDRAILNAMVDLQRFIPALRQHNTNTYLHDQVTETGRAAQLALPVGRLDEIWIVDADPAKSDQRYWLKSFPWAMRYALIRGDQIEDGDYLYAINSDNRTCLIHPGLTTATKCEVKWSGIKLAYGDNDALDGNWDQAVEAVAEYAKSKVVHNYDKDSVARSQRHEASYTRLRRDIYLELRQ